MSPANTFNRLRAADPATVQSDRGRTAVAQAALERILSEPATTQRHARKRLRGRLPRGGVAVAIALGLAGGGAAVAATNPFGWWSSNPSEAKFALNPSAHVRTPSVWTVDCHAAGAAGFVCRPAALDSLGRPHARGQIYQQIYSIEQPNRPGLFTRANFVRGARKLPRAQAAKFLHDLARVPDSFFTELRLASRYQTLGGGNPGQRVPPPGTPEFLVCEQTRSTLSCQNLNGDQHAPIGAGVYAAQPAPDWRPAAPERQGPYLPPGIHFTRAEYQVLFDMGKFATTTSSGGVRHSASAKASAAPAR